MRYSLFLLCIVFGSALCQRRTEWPDGGEWGSEASGDGSEESDEAGEEEGVPEGASEAGAGGPPEPAVSEDKGKIRNAFDIIFHNSVHDRIHAHQIIKAPGNSLAGLPEQRQRQLPLQARLEIEKQQMLKAVALNELLEQMSDKQFTLLNWCTLAPEVPAMTFNMMSPHRLHQIDWECAMANLSPEQMYQLDARTVGYIPSHGWAHITPEAFAQIEPRNLAKLDIRSLRTIPRGHYDTIPPYTLKVMDKEKLAAIDPQLLATVVASSPELPPFDLGFTRPPLPTTAPPEETTGEEGVTGEGAQDDEGQESTGSGAGEDDATEAPAEPEIDCDELTLGELTQLVSAGNVSLQCRRRFQRLSRLRVYRNRRLNRKTN